MKCLRSLYTKVKDSNRKSGEELTSCKYYNEMDRIFGSRDNVNPRVEIDAGFENNEQLADKGLAEKENNPTFLDDSIPQDAFCVSSFTTSTPKSVVAPNANPASSSPSRTSSSPPSIQDVPGSSGSTPLNSQSTIQPSSSQANEPGLKKRKRINHIELALESVMEKAVNKILAFEREAEENLQRHRNRVEELLSEQSVQIYELIDEF
ncbi:hypothetical protein JTE90_019638 [Oedothorax gibbosus]|uniref:Uncharacterized protein n=1 Tax=Oedothorax gibbosus TaxID=931172 RepID=A0AAV6TX15_9ARAC|nr:hypothetical protein JTE90_019638 [Oedothorax gibbosus]